MKRIAGPSGTPVGRVAARWVARWLVTWGRFRLVSGNCGRAIRAFEGALARAPLSFDAWLHLARAHLRDHDPSRARRALARAREASPARFDREATAWVRREGFDLTIFTDAASRTEPAPRHPAMKTAGGGALALPYGDCSDLDEYARFRAMPPIAPSEWQDVDWDEVAEDLQDG